MANRHSQVLAICAGLSLFALFGCGQEPTAEARNDPVEAEPAPASVSLNEPSQCLTREPEEIQWHTCNGPDSVQYGQPGTDFRAIRFDCMDNHPSIAFPVDWPGEGVSEMAVEFPEGEQRTGEVVVLGDGTNLWVEFQPGDPLPARLVQGDMISFVVDETEYEIPIAGGREMLLTLVRSCMNAYP